MTGLAFATVEEAAPFLEGYERGRFEELAEGDVLMDDRLIVTIIGSGKVKATLRTERFLRAHRLDLMVHVGLCVALRADSPLASLVSMKQVLEGDRIEVSLPAYPRIPLEHLDDTLEEGILVTQDHPMQSGHEQTYWQRIADHQDTTGYAVAYVCATHGVSTRILKAVGGHSGESSANVRAARRQAADALATYLIRHFD
jgi:nucleoside phosphorylase